MPKEGYLSRRTTCTIMMISFSGAQTLAMNMVKEIRSLHTGQRHFVLALADRISWLSPQIYQQTSPWVSRCIASVGSQEVVWCLLQNLAELYLSGIAHMSTLIVQRDSRSFGTLHHGTQRVQQFLQTQGDLTTWVHRKDYKVTIPSRPFPFPTMLYSVAPIHRASTVGCSFG